MITINNQQQKLETFTEVSAMIGDKLYTELYSQSDL